METIIRDIAKRKKLITWMLENNIGGMTEAIKYFNLYRKNPADVEKIMSGKK